MYKIFLLYFFLLIPFLVKADFIDALKANNCETILELYIENRNVTAKLEIGEKDFQRFSDIIPERYIKGGYSASDQEDRLNKFLQSVLVLKSGGQVILGEAIITEQRERELHDSYLNSNADSAAVDEQIIYVEVKYAIESEIKSLSINLPAIDTARLSQASIGFVVYHKKVPVNDLQLLTDTQVIYLNWNDPWYSYFENEAISRHHKSSFMSFLYIEPYEVRHEILGRLKDMEDWIDLKYEMDDEIPVAELDSLKGMIAKFLASRNPVIIDGEAIEPIIDVINFVQVNLDGVQVMEIPKPIPYASAIVGVIFAYPHESMPKKVSMNWDMFNDNIQQIPCMTIDPAGPWPYDLNPSESKLEWTNFLKHYKLPMITEQKVEAASINIPVFSIVFFLMIVYVLFKNGWKLKGLSRWRKFFFALYVLLCIISYPIVQKVTIPFSEKKSYTAPEALQLINHLLKNTYRAFDFRAEGDIYDKLALSTSSELLQEIYLQTRRSLVVEDQGGMEVKVNEVLVTEVEEISAEDGLAFRCNWIVKGAIGHWGHKHQRINRYNAIIRVASFDGIWKMDDVDIIDEVRL